MEFDAISSISSSEVSIKNTTRTKKHLKFSGKITRRISQPEQNLSPKLSRDQKKAVQISRMIDKQEMEAQRKMKKVKSEEPNQRSPSELSVQHHELITPAIIDQTERKVFKGQEQKLTLNPRLTIKRNYELAGLLNIQRSNNTKFLSKYDNSSHYNGHGQQYTNLYPINNDITYETSILLCHFTQFVDPHNTRRHIDKNYLEQVLREQRMTSNKFNKM